MIVVKWQRQVMRRGWSLIQLGCGEVKAVEQTWATSPVGSSPTTNTAFEGIGIGNDPRGETWHLGRITME